MFASSAWCSYFVNLVLQFQILAKFAIEYAQQGDSTTVFITIGDSPRPPVCYLGDANTCSVWAALESDQHDRPPVISQSGWFNIDGTDVFPPLTLRLNYLIICSKWVVFEDFVNFPTETSVHPKPVLPWSPLASNLSQIPTCYHLQCKLNIRSSQSLYFVNLNTNASLILDTPPPALSSSGWFQFDGTDPFWEPIQLHTFHQYVLDISSKITLMDHLHLAAKISFCIGFAVLWFISIVTILNKTVITLRQIPITCIKRKRKLKNRRVKVVYAYVTQTFPPYDLIAWFENECGKLRKMLPQNLLGMQNFKFFTDFQTLPQLPTKIASLRSQITPTLNLWCTWDSVTYSCAIDTVITMLANIYVFSSKTTQNRLQTLSYFSKRIFTSIENGKELNHLRTEIYAELHFRDPTAFPMGNRRSKCPIEMMAMILGTNSIDWGYETFLCPKGCPQMTLQVDYSSAGVIYGNLYGFEDILNTPSTFMNAFQRETPVCQVPPFGHCCDQCGNPTTNARIINENTPCIFISAHFDVYDFASQVEESVEAITVNEKGEFYTKTFNLAGIIYFEDGHYTCLMQIEGSWFDYDGIIQGGQPSPLPEAPEIESLAKWCGRDCCGLLYVE
ncbi:hypothetical protein HDU76_012798 [Blyttiomyces sp. JEL0837]|nr:hypothetical protein HDU76_012798 [Blyttiomyces sp. JEL0837]